MPETDDMGLLRQYAAGQSEPAFAALVERHVILVYSAALRGVGNPHAAEEIAQAVFIILARKAEKLPLRTVLPGWLYETTRLTAANYVRGEVRRQRREQEAYMQSLVNEPAPDAWQQIAPLLDDALDWLNRRDRDAIVLRFFENKNLREVGAAFGASEDAAKMRVNRALDKLRKFFSKRGVDSTAAAISETISVNSIQAAPVALAKTVTAVALAKGAAASTSTLTLVNGALKIMAWTKMKTSAVVAASVLLASGTTTMVVKEVQDHKTYPWQENGISDVFRTVPPQVRIVPTKYPSTTGGGSLGGGDAVNGYKFWGSSQTVQDIVLVAYGQSLARTAFVSEIPSGRFDYIANLPSGNSEALQDEIKRKFAMVGTRETRETVVLALEVQIPDGSGIKRYDPRRQEQNARSSSLSGQGYFASRNQGLLSLAGFLESRFKIPVVDQTELTGLYDIDLTWNEPDPRHPNQDALKQALLDQLGLELVPTNMPIEMLVVEKAK